MFSNMMPLLGGFRQQRFPDARFFQYMKREWIALTRSLPQSVA